MIRKVFFSFHFDNDVMRVQQVRNIGVIENEEPIEPNEWEEVTDGGDDEVEAWIDKTLKGKDCVVVLIGEETHLRPWVELEIRKAWRADIPMIGVRIHNLKCPRNGLGKKGKNPFETIPISGGTKMSDYIKVYDPDSSNSYKDISSNLEKWVELAIKNKS